ncbi:hypothetical protein BASA81_002963 [Batrachochytrium salamandrivorans]|nr:hypothetical protein BASA81_002963 [Batrachochytrium salamandrivorans]
MMRFDVGDEVIEGLLDELEEWASSTVREAEDQARTLDVTPQFYSPQDFWSQNTSGTVDIAWEDEGEGGGGMGREKAPAVSPLQQEQFLMLKRRANGCDLLLGHVDKALCDLDLIESQHKLVSEKTHSLHDMCKRLLNEQTRLDKVVAGIQTPMTYFLAVDEISPRFGLVGKNPKLQPPPSSLHPDDAQFKRDLAKLDECIHFIASHPHYHDAEEYTIKFTTIQLRGMKMIETWVGQEIATLERKQKLTVVPSTTTTTTSFLDDSGLYFRFLEKGKVLRPAIIELEKRPKVGFPVVQSLMRQLCDLRLKLVQELVLASPELRNPSVTNIASKILIGSEFLSRVCVAEHTVVSSYFSLTTCKQLLLAQHHSQVQQLHKLKDDHEEEEGSFHHVHGADPFFSLLEALSSLLYDVVRPLVVKELDLDSLCDASSAVESAIQELEARMDLDAAEPLILVLTRIALDLQERICFCVVRIIREEISQPKHRTKWLEQDMFKTWFPSLEITLSTLSKVYRTVDSNVFEQLATEAVSACTSALCDMGKIVAIKKSLDEADLFLVQHLLILREQISPFRAMLTSKERKIDYTPTSRALTNLLQFKRPTGFLNLVRFAGPTFQETDFNSKRELDQSLRHASESFILRVSKRALGPLLEFVDRSQAYLQRDDATWEGLCAQDFASLSTLVAGVTFCEEHTVKEIAAAKLMANQFLANAQTRGVLFHAIETNAFKICTTASNFALDMFKQEQECNDRLRELVRVVGQLKT